MLQQEVKCNIPWSIVSEKGKKRAFEKKVHPREFQERDLVLKKIIPIQKKLSR
jgi:hypothetical protein